MEKDAYMLAFEDAMKLLDQNKFDEAKEKFLFSLEGNRKSGDEQGIAVNLYFLAQILARNGDKQTALNHIDEMKAIYQRRHDPAMLDKVNELESDILNYQPEISSPKEPVDGVALFNQGKIPEALEIFKRDVTVFQRRGHQKFLATSLFYLAQCELLMSRFADARSHLDRASEISKQFNFPQLSRQIAAAYSSYESAVKQEKLVETIKDVFLSDTETNASAIITGAIKDSENAIANGKIDEAEKMLYNVKKLMPEPAPLLYIVLIMFTESKLLKAKGNMKAAKIVVERAMQLANRTNGI